MFVWILSQIVSRWVSRHTGNDTVQYYSWRIKFRILFLYEWLIISKMQTLKILVEELGYVDNKCRHFRIKCSSFNIRHLFLRRFCYAEGFRLVEAFENKILNLTISESQNTFVRVLNNITYLNKTSWRLSDLSLHNGASWTEGRIWDLQFYAVPMKKIFFFRVLLLDNSLCFKMTYWNYM